MYFFKNVDITNIFSSFGETEKPEKEEDKQKDGKTPCIDPKVVHTSRRTNLFNFKHILFINKLNGLDSRQ
jgi:hypothetical protein